MDDLPTRLREEVAWEPEVGDLMREAADEIERLRQSDRPQPIKPADDTPATNTTPSEVSVHGEGTVGERLVERLSITQAMLDDNETLRAEIERLRDGAAASRETVCPHVRGTVTQHCSLNFTLTDAEREAVAGAADLLIGSKPGATLRTLLDRLHT